MGEEGRLGWAGGRLPPRTYSWLSEPVSYIRSPVLLGRRRLTVSFVTAIIYLTKVRFPDPGGAEV